MRKHRVLIVGGGFGGLKAALELSRHDTIAVTLLTDRDHFRYYPSLYHTATGGLRAQSRLPLDKIVTEAIRVEIGTATRLDHETRQVTTEDGRQFAYDTLILALGMVTNYFGIKGLEQYSFGIKSLEQIDALKTHLHQQLTSSHAPDLNYVVVGGGPTGIELAGALPSYLHSIMEAHGIAHRAVHVDLVEALPRLLPRSAPAVSRAVRRRLRALGIRLYLKSKVEGLDSDSLTVNGKPIHSHTVIWTAGVANHPFFKANNFALNERGKVVINEQLQAAQHIYVIGDNAATPYSGLAQTALYDAEFVSRTILRQLEHKKLKPYKAKKPVSVVPAGPGWAAVELGRWHFSGRLGWLLRQAADWIGFHDLLPWRKASVQWLTEWGKQEDCPTCVAALNEQ